MALPHSFRFVIGSAANAHGITRARWSKHIVDEVRGAILKNRPDLDPRRIERTMELMSQAVRDALVSGYEELIAGLSLPDCRLSRCSTGSIPFSS